MMFALDQVARVDFRSLLQYPPPATVEPREQHQPRGEREQDPGLRKVR
jgi:hypothetical protein